MGKVIDHVAIGAASLQQGIHALRQLLSVEMPPGGKHPAMSTHNCVTRIGEGKFLEIIAIDREAPEPSRKRWFTMDKAATQSRLKSRPRALCWVVGTDDLDGLVANSPVDLGEILPLSRGNLTWRITVPSDGSLPEGGLIPAFIEWPPGRHPSEGMQDLGIRLKSISLRHPDPNGLRTTLRALDVDHLADVTAAGAPSLSFIVETLDGRTIELD
ncbi:MAG: VOC family protein [Hyphomicrobiaceae bacterium]